MPFGDVRLEARPLLARMTMKTRSSANRVESQATLKNPANDASTHAPFASRIAQREWVQRLLAGQFVGIVVLWCILSHLGQGCMICPTERDTGGTIVITSIQSVKAEPEDCTPDPVRVVGDYITDYGEVVANVEVGYGLPREWVERNGMTVGSRHPANYTTGCGSGVALTDVGYNSSIEREPVPCPTP